MVLKRQTVVILATLVFALSLLLFSASARSQPAEDALDEDSGGARYAAGELIVVYEEEAARNRVSSVNRALSTVEEASGVEVSENLSEIDAQVLEFPEVKGDASKDSREESLEEMKRELEESPEVEEVYYNYVRTGFFAPRDPYFRFQYGITKPRFNLVGGWLRFGARVAVVDSGMAVGHPDLRRKTFAAYDFRNNNRSVEDLNGHGTHIAGIVAAQTNNRRGVAGACPVCKIVVAKALDRNLIGFDSDIARAINWSVNRGAKVVNLSLGSDAGPKSVMKNSIDYATRRGAVVVAAGGNYGDGRRVWPASYNNVLAVGYTNSADRRAANSSYGPWLNVVAPGVSIVSTIPGGRYGYKSGSSFSAPHASAIAGIMFSQGARRENVIRVRIQQTAVDLGPRGRDNLYGSGRINADRASLR